MTVPWHNLEEFADELLAPLTPSSPSLAAVITTTTSQLTTDFRFYFLSTLSPRVLPLTLPFPSFPFSLHCYAWCLWWWTGRVTFTARSYGSGRSDSCGGEVGGGGFHDYYSSEGYVELMSMMMVITFRILLLLFMMNI